MRRNTIHLNKYKSLYSNYLSDRVKKSPKSEGIKKEVLKDNRKNNKNMAKNEVRGEKDKIMKKMTQR